MKSQELRERAVCALDEAEAIQATAEGEDRGLTEDEQGKFDALLADNKAFKVRADRADDLERGKTELEKSNGRKVPAEAVANYEIDGPTKVHADGSVSREVVRVGATLATNDPKRGFASPAVFMRAVMSAGMSGGLSLDDRLKPLRVKAAAGGDEHGEYADPYGGFLIPVGFSPGVLSIRPEDDFTAGRTRPWPMEQPVVEVAARVDKTHTSSVSGGLSVSRKAETAAATASRMQLEKVRLTAHSLFGLSYATEELLADSPSTFAAMIASSFSEEFTSVLINEKLNGDGVGEFLGIMNSPCLVSQAKEGSQTADTIVYNNVLKMRSRCWGYQNAIWITNHDCYPQVAILADAGNNSVYTPSAREDRPDLLLGRPIFYTEYAKTIGDKGDIVLANWGEFLEGTLQPLEQAESIHVRFSNHERTFKFWLRNAGTPWWSAALTPKNSTNTLSPFVTLDARA